MTLRSSTAPTSAATRKEAGIADQDVAVEGAGRVGPEQVLHDVGRVGADHHQLAVRHVDDAHQAVGDRQAERDQQQDRAEADAGEEHAEPLAPGEAAAHRVERLLQRRAHLRVGLAAGAEPLLQQARDRALAARRQLLGRGQALAAVRRGDQDRGAHALEVRLQRRIGLGRQRLVDQRQLAFVERRLAEIDDRRRAAPRGRARTGAASDSAASSAPRMRLLLMTSSASSGSVAGCAGGGDRSPCRRAR